ncbi:MAG: cytochrome P450, partial [Acidimicrobiales bacterium]
MTNGGIGGRFPDVDLTDLDRFADGFPHDVFARLRSEAPVWWHPPTAHTPGGEGFWVVSRYDDVLAAATDAVTFSSDG